MHSFETPSETASLAHPCLHGAWEWSVLSSKASQQQSFGAMRRPPTCTTTLLQSLSVSNSWLEEER